MCKGGESEYNLSGTFHQDYQQGVVNKRRPDEQPFSIILALENSNFNTNMSQLMEHWKKSLFPLGMWHFFQAH
jgi:hypothetical protein